jgi:aspartyl-tRNA(Asn)/glutamyl-tRNA(Gln) amidotransferase subunit C
VTITRDTVLHVARLAQIELSEPELERMQRDLGRILEYVRELDALDTASVAETAHVALEATPLREDVTAPGVESAAVLAEAARTAAGGFAVPAFVEDA